MAVAQRVESGASGRVVLAAVLEDADRLGASSEGDEGAAGIDLRELAGTRVVITDWKED